MSYSVKKYRGGFTLLEALVAMMVLAGSLVALQGIVSRCMYRVRVNEEKERAWQVLDRQMTAIDAMGIDTYMQEPLTEGEIEEYGMLFNWRVDTSIESIDCMYEVRITIWWGPETNPHVISATTKLNGAIPALASVGEEI